MIVQRRVLSWVPMVVVTALALAAPGAASVAEEHGWNWTDARREGAVWTALALNPHLNPFQFSVEVNDGEAILEGTVDDEVKRDLAEEVAKGVDGIEKVTNNITIEHEYQAAEESEQRTLWEATGDATTTAAVKSRLLWNRHVSGLNIRVSTEKGVTTLKGEVATDEEHSLAEELALNSRGVESVINELVVNPEMEMKREREPARYKEDDTVGFSAVRSRDDAEPAPDTAPILPGADEPMDDPEEPGLYEDPEHYEDEMPEDEGRTAGEVLSDAWITTKVKSALVFTRNVPGVAISVQTEEGVVELSGTVESLEKKALAIETAEDIKGVEMVIADNLLVEPPMVEEYRETPAGKDLPDENPPTIDQPGAVPTEPYGEQYEE